MIAAAIVLSGLAAFEEADLPGVHIGEANPLTGAVAGNFRAADLNADGLKDIVTAERVYFQFDGTYPQSAAADLPDREIAAGFDVHAGKIYAVHPDGLAAYKWAGDRWIEAGAWNLDGGAAQWAAAEILRPEYEGAGARLAQVLYDLDGDGIPEALVPQTDGLAVYALRENRLERAYLFDVYPAYGFSELPPANLWPSAARRLQFPPRKMSCQLAVEPAGIVVISRRELPTGDVRFETVRYRFAWGSEEPLLLQARSETPPLPSFVAPVRLNTDDIIDFAGGDWSLSEAAPLPVPVFLTVATLDGGERIQTFRSRSFRPKCSFTDVNGDGRLDLITEHMDIFGGGIRESISRLLSQRALNHEVRVHYQDEDGRFPRLPSFRRPLEIRLSKAPFRRGDMFQRYQSGGLIDLTGDFNGDGLSDLAVQERTDRLAIYLNSGNGYANTAAATLRMLEHWRFGVADIDGDGRSDIALEWIEDVDGEPVAQGRIYLSRFAR